MRQRQGQTSVAAAGTPVRYFTTCDADFTLANQSTAQACFPAAQDTFTTPASMAYRFEVFLSGSVADATTCTKALSFGGTATFTSIRYWSIGQHVALNSQGTTQNSAHVDTASATILIATGTTSWWIAVRGLMRINGAGTIIPQLTLSATLTGANLIKKDSYMILEPFGTDAVASLGAWS